MRARRLTLCQKASAALPGSLSGQRPFLFTSAMQTCGVWKYEDERENSGLDHLRTIKPLAMRDVKSHQKDADGGAAEGSGRGLDGWGLASRREGTIVRQGDTRAGFSTGLGHLFLLSTGLKSTRSWNIFGCPVTTGVTG